MLTDHSWDSGESILTRPQNFNDHPFPHKREDLNCALIPCESFNGR